MTSQVHLGVETKAACFKLETRAVNCASFRIPDESGWQPHDEAIDPALPLDACITTGIHCMELAEQLRGKHDVQVSSDAGLYVCKLMGWIGLFVERLYLN
jgi:pyrrolidone-carboxylate peptidase